MAKKDGDNKAGKKGKRIPKEVAGIRLPKELRHAGEALLAKANSPAGREMIASGLTMAAAAATAAAVRQRAKASAAKADAAGGAAKPGEEPGKGGTTGDAPHIAEVISNAADALLDRVFGAKRPG